MLAYPVELTPDDNDTFMVTFPDVPEAVTYGDTEEEALAHAVDALETALAAYITDRRNIPEASEAEGGPTVAPGLLASLKLQTYIAMRARGWRKADLARALDLNPRQVDRLLDLRHASTIAQIEQALAACQASVEVERDALPRIDVVEAADKRWTVSVTDRGRSDLRVTPARYHVIVKIGLSRNEAVELASEESAKRNNARILIRPRPDLHAGA